MVLTNKKDKVKINVLHHEKDYGVLKKFNEFLSRNCPPSFLNKLLMKINETGTVDCKPGSGKKHKIRIAQKLMQLRNWCKVKKMQQALREPFVRLKRLEFSKRQCIESKHIFSDVL